MANLLKDWQGKRQGVIFLIPRQLCRADLNNLPDNLLWKLRVVHSLVLREATATLACHLSTFRLQENTAECISILLTGFAIVHASATHVNLHKQLILDLPF